MRPAPLLFACAIFLGAAAALAEPFTVPKPPRAIRFEYRRGPGTEDCPPEQPVRDIMTDVFRSDPVKPDAGPLIVIAVTRKGRGFHAEINVYDAAGTVVWADKMDHKALCWTLMRSAVVDARFGAQWYLPQEA